MSTEALITGILVSFTLWGGLAAIIILAIKKEKNKKNG